MHRFHALAWLWLGLRLLCLFSLSAFSWSRACVPATRLDEIRSPVPSHRPFPISPIFPAGSRVVYDCSTSAIKLSRVLITHRSDRDRFALVNPMRFTRHAFPSFPAWNFCRPITSFPGNSFKIAGERTRNCSLLSFASLLPRRWARGHLLLGLRSTDARSDLKH